MNVVAVGHLVCGAWKGQVVKTGEHPWLCGFVVLGTGTSTKVQSVLGKVLGS